MAETIVSVIAENVMGRVISLASDEVSLAWGVKNDVQELVRTLTAIKAVLLDAEKKQIHNQRLSVWLENLMEVCYDVEDVLDEVEVEDLRKQVVNRQTIARKVGHFFSSSNPVASRFTLGHKIKEIKNRLAKIAADKNDFNLTEKTDSNHAIGGERETHSFVYASDVIGRDKDKKMIVEILLHPSDGGENVSVIPIVGIGGLGKTTLAKWVYNDDIVSDHFSLKMWVCASDEFFLKKLLIEIINSAIGQKFIDKSIDQLQTILRDNLRNKKYLLVLDDVWNENRELWLELKSLLIECVSGSKIIVTARSDLVASIMGTVPTYKLEGLSFNECMSMFVKYAFKEGQEKNHPNLIEIGKEIVKKCGGIPLAVKTLGSLLYSSTSEQDWINVRDNEIWKLDQKENSILNALKISYNHLSPPLKQCFVYCSMFPKDFIFHNTAFVRIWMAHGLLKAHNENEDSESIGTQYIKELMGRSFFQDIEELVEDTYSFKIHDLMHDVATSLFQNECFIVKGSNQIGSKFYRHLSVHLFDARVVKTVEALSFLPNLGNLRSIMVFVFEGGNITISQSFLELIVSRCQFLRALYLVGLNIEAVPKRIGNLKHLGYLDLSHNPKIKKLPASIYKLQNLQWLSLAGCMELEGLTRDVKYLVSLTHLDLTTMQKHLPNNAIGCLNSLRSLWIHNCSNLEYLFEDIGRLRVLRRLCISACPRLISLPHSVRSLSSLEDLRLRYCRRLNLDLSIGSDKQDNHEELSSTGPPLRLLLIEGLPHWVELPQWLLQCSKNTLRELRISECPELATRCKPETGENWSKIAHIPKIILDGKIIKSTEN